MAIPDLRNGFGLFGSSIEQAVLHLILEVLLEENKNSPFKNKQNNPKPPKSSHIVLALQIEGVIET